MIPSLALAGTPTCNEVLQACDKAFEAKKKEVQLCDLALKKSVDQNAALTKEIKDKEASGSSIFKNPFFLMGIGLVGGLIINRK